MNYEEESQLTAVFISLKALGILFTMSVKERKCVCVCIGDFWTPVSSVLTSFGILMYSQCHVLKTFGLSTQKARKLVDLKQVFGYIILKRVSTRPC